MLGQQIFRERKLRAQINKGAGTEIILLTARESHRFHQLIIDRQTHMQAINHILFPMFLGFVMTNEPWDPIFTSRLQTRQKNKSPLPHFAPVTKSLNKGFKDNIRRWSWLRLLYFFFGRSNRLPTFSTRSLNPTTRRMKYSQKQTYNTRINTDINQTTYNSQSNNRIRKKPLHN